MKRRAFLGSTAAALAAAACGGGGDDHHHKPPIDPNPNPDPDPDPNPNPDPDPDPNPDPDPDPNPDPDPDPDPNRAAHIDAMKRAATYMDQTVSYQGAYVWSYLASDRNKCWGEMEAYSTMCWMQPTGTPSVGNCLLDAYHATGDETFYRAAERTALAMIEAQHPAGGWNYIYDFAGEASLKKWYETIGINGWRLEEFQHYYGNATFDDATTSVSSQFMLRMALEKQDPRFMTSISKAIEFVVNAQFDNGIARGLWPQRFPRAYNATQAMPAPNWPPTGSGWEHLQPGAQNGDFITEGPGDSIKGYTGIFCGMEDRDYTNFATFNDDVIAENIKLLFLCMFGLGRTDLKERAVQAMDGLTRIMYRYNPGSRGQPEFDHRGIPCVKQAGWGLQHLSTDTVDAYGVRRRAGEPAAARGYEPRGLSPSTCINNANLSFHFFRLTGDPKYLYGLDDVLDWVDTCALRPDQRQYNATSNPTGDPDSILGNTHARVVELGTNRPRFPHRYGNNIWNGAYYFDYDWRRTPSHYSASQNANTATPRATLARLSALTNAEVAAMVSKSPLNAMSAKPLPKYFSAGGEVDFPHLFEGSVKGTTSRTAAQNATLISGLGEKNYWSSAQSNLTNDYTQNGSSTPYLGKEYMSRNVGDTTDTSPFANSSRPAGMPGYEEARPTPQVINSSTFVSNMNNLTIFLAPVTAETAPEYKA